jgi:hypothetical protein
VCTALPCCGTQLHFLPRVRCNLPLQAVAVWEKGIGNIPSLQVLENPMRNANESVSEYTMRKAWKGSCDNLHKRVGEIKQMYEAAGMWATQYGLESHEQAAQQMDAKARQLKGVRSARGVYGCLKENNLLPGVAKGMANICAFTPLHKLRELAGCHILDTGSGVSLDAAMTEAAAAGHAMPVADLSADCEAALSGMQSKARELMGSNSVDCPMPDATVMANVVSNHMSSEERGKLLHMLDVIYGYRPKANSGGSGKVDKPFSAWNLFSGAQHTYLARSMPIMGERSAEVAKLWKDQQRRGKEGSWALLAAVVNWHTGRVAQGTKRGSGANGAAVKDKASASASHKRMRNS